VTSYSVWGEREGERGRGQGQGQGQGQESVVRGRERESRVGQRIPTPLTMPVNIGTGADTKVNVDVTFFLPSK